MKMNIVVDGVAGNDQPESKGVETGLLSRIGMPEGNAH